MKLSKLLRGIDYKNLTGPADVEITGIAYNSGSVARGNLFAALRGDATDGHRYLGSALEAGAAAALVEEPLYALPERIREALTVVEVADTREALARISASFYGNPTRGITLAGVTGTNGKTTVTYLMESIWREGGRNPGLIGTIETRFGALSTPSPLTTPESTDLMSTLADMAGRGADSIVMEVSSHALSRKRVSGCHFDASIFTNLSQDHLDYHGTMEEYFREKKKLFTDLLELSDKEEKYSIINLDDEFGRRLAKEAKGTIITYSKEPGDAAVYCRDYEIDRGGITATAVTPWGRLAIRSPLFGEHNLYNILAALCCALPLGASLEEAERGVARVKDIPGRLERVQNGAGIEVLVDYAHTPDALKNVLHSVRALTPGRVILVFGCGGDRDAQKRPLMGRIGRDLADVLVVTSDNPRTESPEAIIDQIEGGFLTDNDNAKPYWRVDDRREAIGKALLLAEPGDTVLIAGKGHEDYQIIGKTKYPFDDREVARSVLNHI